MTLKELLDLKPGDTVRCVETGELFMVQEGHPRMAAVAYYLNRGDDWDLHHRAAVTP